MSEIWNLSALCRCCHADGNFKNLQMPYRHGDTIEVYSNMLRECLGISIVPPPIEASYAICDACINKLRDSNDFRKQVLECEQKFLIYCQNEASVNPNMIIKLEPEENFEIKNLDKLDVEIERKYDRPSYDPGQSYNSDECKEETSDYFDHDHEDDEKSLQDIKAEPHATVKWEDANTKETKKNVKSTAKPNVKTRRQRSFIKKETRMFCAVCNEIFHKKVDVDNHVKSKHEPPIQCTECFKQYEDYAQFKKHVIDGCRRRFRCKFCDKSYNTYPAVLAHENSVHTKTSYYQCDICQKQFGYKSVLRKHILYHLGLQKTCVCDHCGHGFNDRANLKIHIMNVHEKIRRFSCDICEKRFSLKKHLKKHFIRHQGEKREQCPDCPKKFYDAYDLRGHIRSVHGKDPGAAQNNKGSSDVPKVYNCPACEKKFYHRGLYARHLKKHRDNGALPYTCEICGKNFAGKYVLNRHVESHTNIAIRKKFPCVICQKDFCTKASLDRHARVIHDPENDRFAQKIKCPICKVYVKNLERHQKRHQFRPHACSLCSKTYPERNALNRHVKHIHLGVKLHCCQICGKEYTRPDVLKTHIKRKHNNQIVLKVEPENYENDVPAFAIEVSS